MRISWHNLQKFLWNIIRAWLLTMTVDLTSVVSLPEGFERDSQPTLRTLTMDPRTCGDQAARDTEPQSFPCLRTRGASRAGGSSIAYKFCEAPPALGRSPATPSRDFPLEQGASAAGGRIMLSSSQAGDPLLRPRSVRVPSLGTRASGS